jgi:hypothetical protein
MCPIILLAKGRALALNGLIERGLNNFFHLHWTRRLNRKITVAKSKHYHSVSVDV